MDKLCNYHQYFVELEKISVSITFGTWTAGFQKQSFIFRVRSDADKNLLNMCKLQNKSDSSVVFSNYLSFGRIGQKFSKQANKNASICTRVGWFTSLWCCWCRVVCRSSAGRPRRQSEGTNLGMLGESKCAAG